MCFFAFCFPRCHRLLGDGMAKTKKSIAERRTDLHAAPPNGSAPNENADGGGAPSNKRLKSKTTVKTEVADPIPDRCNFELKWENIGKVMAFFKLSERDATKLLLEVVGPDPGGSNFWATYAHRIKQERLEAAQQEALEKSQASARGAEPVLPPILPDNQEGDETLFPKLVEPTDFDEGEEEEMGCTDDEDISDDPDVVGVAANCGNGGDDQDSPNSGAAAIAEEPKVKVCSKQPEEPIEPVRTPVQVCQAARDAGDEFRRRVQCVPTPMTESTVAHAGVSTPPLRSLESFDFISTSYFLCLSLFLCFPKLMFHIYMYIYIFPNNTVYISAKLFNH